MTVVDGRTDPEKLAELLASGAEDQGLDFKATLDLTGKSTKDVLNFVKDTVAMMNTTDGGYLVIGVDDHGQPAHGQAPVDPSRFDSADLRAKVSRFVEARVLLVAQAHRVDGRDVVLVHVPPNPDGLPIPMSRVGEYDDGGRAGMTRVFDEGEVVVREGTSNVRLRYAHWHGLLARYREQVRKEAQADADALIRRAVEAIGTSTSGTLHVPLDVGMSEEALAEALVATFESQSTVRVKQFLNTAKQTAGSAGAGGDRQTWLAVLDRIAIVACQAVVYERADVYRLAVDTLDAVYRAQGLPPDAMQLGGSDAETAQRLLDVLLRVMAIGSLVVREEAWGYLGTLALRPVQVGPNYVYASWLRHGAVQASRAGLLQGEDGKNRGGQLISLSRALVAERPALRPDHSADVTLPEASTLSPSDWLLNSLCQWDLWWCLLAAADTPEARRNGGVFYPSCAALHQHRSQPTLDRIANDAAVRRSAFGDEAADSEIARAMVEVVGVAVQQSHQYGGWWGGLRDSADVLAYVEMNFRDA